MASRSIDLISKKTNCTWSTLFFLISKKTNLHVQHAFCLFLPLFCTTTMPFCRTKTSNFLLTHYFYGGIVIYAYPIFCLLQGVYVSFYFSLPPAFLIVSHNWHHHKSLGSGQTRFNRILWELSFFNLYMITIIHFNLQPDRRINTFWKIFFPCDLWFRMLAILVLFRWQLNIAIS